MLLNDTHFDAKSSVISPPRLVNNLFTHKMAKAYADGAVPAADDLKALALLASAADLTSDLASWETLDLRIALEACSVPSRSPLALFTNWARTFECRPTRVFAPSTALQCRQIVELARRDGATVHPVGVGHSPSDLACTDGWLVRMEGLSGTLEVGFCLRDRANFRYPTRKRLQHTLLVRLCIRCTPPSPLPLHQPLCATSGRSPTRRSPVSFQLQHMALVSHTP